MKVADVMQKNVEFISPESSILEASRLIFGRGINGLPVCRNMDIVGFITERDILAKFYPSMQEYVDDPFHSSDFENMENRINEILEMSVDKIMTKNPITVTTDTPLLRAQSIMFVEKVGRLPVVNEHGKLLGILSKGDIFKAVVGQKLPLEVDEQFHDWLSRNYDIIIDQKARLAREIPDLVKLFRKLNIKNVLDVGSGTGVHSIALAQEGFNVLGIDRSSKMIQMSKEKLKALSSDVKQRVKFISENYENFDRLSTTKFDAVILMGSALAHIDNPQWVLQEINKVLVERAVIVCQVTNYDKVIKVNKRFFSFEIRKSPYPEEEEEEKAFLRFYDEKEKGFLVQNVSVLTKSSKKWGFKGMRSLQVYHLTRSNVTAFLGKIKFVKIKYYGGEKGFFYDYLFRKPFKPLISDVLTVVATR